MNKCNFVIVLVHYYSGVLRLIIHGQLFVSSCYSAYSLCSKVKLCKVTWVLFVSGIGWGEGVMLCSGVSCFVNYAHVSNPSDASIICFVKKIVLIFKVTVTHCWD